MDFRRLEQYVHKSRMNFLKLEMNKKNRKNTKKPEILLNFWLAKNIKTYEIVFANQRKKERNES